MQTPTLPHTNEIIRAMPKVELHVHLEGSLRPTTFLRLARRNGLANELGCIDEHSVRELFKFRDFQHFMDLYGKCTYLFKNPDDFALVTEELGLDAAAQGVRYLEATFTAGTHYRFKGMPFDEVMDAIATGAQAAKKQAKIEMRFIIDHVRGFSIEDCYQTAGWCIEGRDRGVVALGLAGYEPGHPASEYAEVLRWAAKQGLPFVPHAGEAVGPEGIWEALKFKPRRIAHGFRAIDDPSLVCYLRDRSIPLEICLTSNVCTGVVPTPAEHPVRRLWDAGVHLTLNTDDPPMFNTTLINEYELASTLFQFSPSDFARMGIIGLQSALIPSHQRMELESSFRADYELLGVDPNW